MRIARKHKLSTTPLWAMQTFLVCRHSLDPRFALQSFRMFMTIRINHISLQLGGFSLRHLLKYDRKLSKAR